MPYIWRLLIAFWLLTGITLSEVKAQQNSSAAAELLRLEQSLWNDSLSPELKAKTQFAKLPLYAELNDWNAVIKAAKNISKELLTEKETSDLERYFLMAFLNTNQTHLAAARLNKFVPNATDTSLILVRAIVQLEHYYWEGFAEEVGRIHPDWKSKALLIAALPEFDAPKTARWLPGFYFKNGRIMKSGIALGIRALPPAMLASAIVAGIPVSGILLGGYFAWRIYGSEKEAMEQAGEKRNRQAVLQKQLAGYELLKQLR
ncbi:MAG: hypothetical protein RLZZ543_1947 [Bacteroidota bacterium]|jgi:hypothetical protein